MRIRLHNTGISFLAVLVLLVAVVCLSYIFKYDRHDYIAHAGGAIDGNPMTNSLEAVENAIAHDMKYIELDLQVTSDNKLVAAHDWDLYFDQTGNENKEIPSYDSFCKSKILGKYTPMTYRLIDSLFSEHPDVWFVTDKVRDMEILENSLPSIKDQIIVECFSPEQYEDCQRRGFRPMRSYNNYYPGGINVVVKNSPMFIYRHFYPSSFAVYSDDRISTDTADSLFSADRRIRFVYVDFLKGDTRATAQ